MENENAYSLTDLCELAEVTPRTVRYYIQQGLLASPGGTGPGARYSEGHLDRLRLTKRLQRVHLPLSEIRGRLAALTDDEVRALLAQEPEAPSESAIDYVRTVLGSKGALPQPETPRRKSLGRTMPFLKEAPWHATQSDSLSSLDLSSEIRCSPGRLNQSPISDPADPQADLPAEPLLLADSEMSPQSVRDVPPPSYAPSTAPDRSSWERITLSPDLELHIRRPLSRVQNRFLTRLLDFARKLIQEDKS